MAPGAGSTNDGHLPGDQARQPIDERLARVMAAIDGRPRETMLPQARATLGEVWRMMDCRLYIFRRASPDSS